MQMIGDRKMENEENWESPICPVTVKRKLTSTGSRITTEIKQQPHQVSECSKDLTGKAEFGKEETVLDSETPKFSLGLSDDEESMVKVEPLSQVSDVSREVAVNNAKKMSFDDFLKATNTKVMSHTPQFSLGLSDDESMVKAEPLSQVSDVSREVAVNSAKKMSFDDFLQATNTKVMSHDECVKLERLTRLDKVVENPVVENPVVENPVVENPVVENPVVENLVVENLVVENPVVENKVVEKPVDGGIKKEPQECLKAQIDTGLDAKPESNLQMVPWEAKVKKEEVGENDVVEATPLNWAKPRLTFPEHDPGFEQLGQKPVSVKKKVVVEDRSLSCVVIEKGDLPVDEDWLLVGGSLVNGLSTTKGRKLEVNEIVHFSFSSNLSARNNTQWIVRFSTKRNGEIGRLPMEWAKCVIPLVSSGRVKVFGRSIDEPKNLSMMQEILLYVSFYVHNSVLVVEGDMSSWKLDAPTYIDTTTRPLLTLFQLLSVKPTKEAQFTPEELDSRKRLLNPQGSGAFPQSKRIKGAPKLPPPPQSNDEQTISESFLNKLVGAAEMYDLQEMEAPSTLMCDLRPYQKQALFWMTEAEKGVDVDKAAKTLHPCWAEYRVCDQRASSPIYVNIFSGEATTRFPAAMEMSRGGILADAMGLGKTVMTIALILARNGKGIPHDSKKLNTRRDDTVGGGPPPRRAKGGTLIICPMALLSQWKDELETHSKEYTLSIFVHYGGGRTDDARVMAGYDVVLTTYGVLQSAYKNDGDQSIYHRVDWHRIVLDEAHIIKCSRTQCAQAAFGLSSHCRWCLTGTPLQNNLEDLYSLLCFLKIEPWCNWAWWNKLIQRPYENGDHRGLTLVKAILRPLMLRRTKETKDKVGRPILVLPPTNIQTIVCDQSEAEHDFYDALFRKSKVEFDQFVAAGKLLHNYANILELLLRLRQCCNHPFLVMSRGDTQKYSDLNKLAKNFINEDPDSASSNQVFPSYAAGGVIGKGKNTECPICLESPDEPVLTQCAHVMCRECLLASWGSNPQMGLCPLCRQLLRKEDLISCPAESQFKLDVEKNWKESSKVLKLLECLERIKRSGLGEKSIVFSQWTSFLDLLEIPMKRRNIGYLRYDGSLSQKHRELVLREFNESNKKTVLLMSLRAGGVGLNLTAASNVFLMDPWWNPAVEEQAIMRIHRIGQKRTVLVRRFIVSETVEERLQQVQAKKQRMIAGALTDEEVRSARIEDLKMLFR